jgi:agmatinase
VTREVREFAGVSGRSGGDPERARVVILQAPYEGSVSYGAGAARGPAAILEASLQVETYDDETGVLLDDLSFALGPTVPAEDRSPEAYSRAMRELCGRVAEGGQIPFVLGGEHSVTIGAVQGVRDVHPGAHVLTIDAHADLRDSYAGSRFSHACVSRRVLEGGPVTIVGVRSWSAGEAELLARRPGGLHVVPAREIVAGRLEVEALLASLGETVYVSVDVDGLDPSVVPATGTPEPGGLSWYDALAILRPVLERRTVVGMDLVELAPVPGAPVADFAAARLAAKMLSYLGPEVGAPEGSR